MESPFSTRVELTLPDIQDDYHYHVIVARHPHLKQSIDWFWGSDLFPKWVSDILRDTGDDTRKGFDVHIVKSLFHLNKLHSESYPQYHVIEDYIDWGR